MSSADKPSIVIAAANASFGTAADDEAARTAEALARVDVLTEQIEALNEILAKPLNEILAERDQFKQAAAAWDAFGAMWMLSQRAMKRVALDLAALQGVSEQEVVSRALTLANTVLNGDGEDLGGTIAEAQMAHIERHKAVLRRQFRQG